MITFALISLCAVAGGIPPLTEDERTALMTADDGGTRDHREAAFWALLQNTARWTGDVGDASIRLNPDFDALLGDPEAYRGELCRVAGRIEQVESLAPPYDGVEAWFVRVEDERPVLVYVDFKNRENSRFDFRSMMRIEIIARFYKRYERIADGEGRDQQVHSYPVFVGAFPRMATVEGGGTMNFAAVIVPLVIVLGGVFLLVFMLAARARRKERTARLSPAHGPIADDENLDLPRDSTEALAVLRDRAENVR
jgi:hypothetical protein